MKRTPSALVAIGWAVAISAAILAPASLPSRALAAEPVRLMIDPGHGGKDPGASIGGLHEKDINLRVSRYVYSSARRQGWAVRMTRYDDTLVPLAQRPRKASQFRATAFVSVHVNSTGKKALGAMTIHRGGASSRLGASIMNELEPLTPYKDLGNRPDVRGLAVLRGATTPAVITELRSLSAPEERRAVQRPDVQKQMAEAIVRGVAEFHDVEYTPPSASKRAGKPKPRLRPKSAPGLVLAEKAAAIEPTATASASTTSAVEPTATPSMPATSTSEPTTTPTVSATGTVEPTATPIAPTPKPIDWGATLRARTTAELEQTASPRTLPRLGIETTSPLESPDRTLSAALRVNAMWRSIFE